MKIKAFAAVLLVLIMSACSDGQNAAISAWGRPHHIKQFSGGVLVGEWDSTGKINETQSDGYYFEDAKTRQVVSVSGTVQITLK
jgi:hypothetical protein